MNLFYWDASALAKRYALENGTLLVNHLFSNTSPNRMMCLSIGTGEIISVFVRKKNAGTIDATTFSQAMTDFRAEVIDSADFKLVAASQAQIFASHLFIERYSLNATDAIVLRSALDIANIYRQTGDDVVLLASDRRLVVAAQGEGLKTFNPEADLQTQLDALISETS